MAVLPRAAPLALACASSLPGARPDIATRVHDAPPPAVRTTPAAFQPVTAAQTPECVARPDRRARRHTNPRDPPTTGVGHPDVRSRSHLNNRDRWTAGAVSALPYHGGRRARVGLADRPVASATVYSAIERALECVAGVHVFDGTRPRRPAGAHSWIATRRTSEVEPVLAATDPFALQPP